MKLVQRLSRLGLLPFVFMVVAGLSVASVAEDQKAVEPSPNASASAAATGGESSHGEASPKKKESSACLVDSAALEDLKKRREELELKAKEIASREAEILSKERALREELKRLDAARDELTKGSVEKKKDADEKLAKLVETVEGMSPKAASQLLATMDESLAVTTVSRMATVKLAKLLNVMEPERSARLTELLNGIRSRKADSSRNSQSEKGGVNNDGRNHESGSPAVAGASSKGNAGEQRAPASSSSQ